MQLRVKAIKKEGKFLKIGKWLLLVFILFVFFFQLYAFDWANAKRVELVSPFFLFNAFFLVIVNWFFEWKKWTAGLKSISDFPSQTIWKGFYAGMLSGFLTPSALGNFLGRMQAVSKEWKSNVIATTVVGNGAQFLVSISFGVLSFFLIDTLPLEMNHFTIKWGLLLAVTLAYFFYFRLGEWRLFKNSLNQYLPSVVSISMQLRFQFVFWSLARYIVFSVQFFLVLKAFQVNLSLVVLFWIWQMYLWTTLSPSIFFGKLFIRETIGIFILSFAGVELPVALFTSILVWLMNNAIPSLFAYFKWKQYVLVEA